MLNIHGDVFKSSEKLPNYICVFTNPHHWLLLPFRIPKTNSGPGFSICPVFEELLLKVSLNLNWRSSPQGKNEGDFKFKRSPKE